MVYSYCSYFSKRPRKLIIPDVTTCCNPPAPHAQPMGDRELLLDADCVSDGDELKCPTHHEKTLFLFGTGWWASNGGTLDRNPKFDVFCSDCQGIYHLSFWSWRG